MTADRLLELLAMLALGCVAAVGLARSVALARRGVWVLPIDRERSVPQALADLGFVVGASVWIGAAVAGALVPGWRLGPAALWAVSLPVWLRWLGLAAAGSGVALYVLALRDLGLSWRFTIDRERAGELVTKGVFAFSRNPIYLALVLLAFGVSLALGRLLGVGLACAAPFYFARLVRREEGFLAACYGERYAAYCAAVPRWVRWRAPPTSADSPLP